MIHQIYFDDESKKNLMKDAKPIFSGSLHPSFENFIIAAIGPTINDDRFGILSHRFKQKHPAKRYNVESIMEKAAEHDVVSFFPKFKQRDMVAFMSNNMKVDFRSIMKRLLRGTGYEIPEQTKFIVYQNAFVAKREIYHDYIEKVLKPAMNNARLIQDDLFKETRYKGNPDALLTLNQRWNKKLKTYPVWPFAFELLFSIYLSNHDYDCKQI